MKEFDMDDIHESVRSAMEEVHDALKNIPETVQGEIHAAMEDIDSELGDDFDAPDEIPTPDEVEQQFAVGPNPELSVRTIAGRISIRADDTPSVRVRATKHGRGRESTWVQMTRQGDHIHVETRSAGHRRSGLIGFNLASASVDYEIVVPRHCRVQVRGVSADITVGGTQSAVTLQTVSGDAAVQDVAGELSASTVSGDVVGERIVGELTLRTTSGDVRIRQSNLRSFILNSVSGDFTIETPLTAGAHYMAKTTSGDLRLLVPAGTAATVSLKTVSGDVAVTDLPTEIVKAGRRRWQGRINGGGAQLEMSSVSGDLRIGLVTGALPEAKAEPIRATQPADSGTPPVAEPSPSAEASAPSAAEQGGERAERGRQAVDVLDALQRGEITIEEAMARLDATS